MKKLSILFLFSALFLSCNQQFYDRERSLEYSADDAYIDGQKYLLCLRGKAYFIDPSIEIKADSIDIHHKSGKVIVYGTENSPAEIYLKQSDVKVLGKYQMSGTREKFYRSFDYYPQINRIRFHTDNQKWKIF